MLLWLLPWLSISAFAQDPIRIPADMDDPHDFLPSRISSSEGYLEVVCVGRGGAGHEKGTESYETLHRLCYSGALALRSPDGKLLALSEPLLQHQSFTYNGERQMEAVDRDFHRDLVVGRSTHRDRWVLKPLLYATSQREFPYDFQVSSRLFKAYAKHLVRSPHIRWLKTENFSIWVADDPHPCESGMPYRHIGRGIAWNEKSLSAVCTDSECSMIQLRIFDRSRGCSYQLGDAHFVQNPNVENVRNALKEMISARYVFEDVVNFFIEPFNIYSQTYNGGPDTRASLVWLPVYDHYIEDLFDPRTVEAILQREVSSWQLRPRKVEHAEFRRWISEFSDSPQLFDAYSDQCFFKTFDIRPYGIRAQTTMKAWGLSGYEAFRQSTGTHERENLILRPAMGRYLRTRLFAHFALDPDLNNAHTLVVHMDERDPTFLRGDGFTVVFRSFHNGKLEKEMRFPTSFKVPDFSRMARKFAESLGCAD